MKISLEKAEVLNIIMKHIQSMFPDKVVEGELEYTDYRFKAEFEIKGPEKQAEGIKE